jgi:hypothetical protein
MLRSRLGFAMNRDFEHRTVQSNYGFHPLVMDLEKFDNGDSCLRLFSGDGLAGLTALSSSIST